MTNILDRVITRDCLHRCDSWVGLYKVLMQMHQVATKICSLNVVARKTRISKKKEDHNLHKMKIELSILILYIDVIVG